jgi:hypothetical protein
MQGDVGGHGHEEPGRGGDEGFVDPASGAGWGFSLTAAFFFGRSGTEGTAGVLAASKGFAGEGVSAPAGWEDLVGFGLAGAVAAAASMTNRISMHSGSRGALTRMGKVKSAAWIAIEARMPCQIRMLFDPKQKKPRRKTKNPAEPWS